MEILPIRTHRINVEDTLEDILDVYAKDLRQGDVVAITSKILSILQGQFVSPDRVSKQDLIVQEADAYVPPLKPEKDLTLTLKEGLLMPSAGIDESNAWGSYLLYPVNIKQETQRIWSHLKATHHLSQVGVLVTDSRSNPLRRGVTGVGLDWCGFSPLYSYIGQQDLDQRPLKATQLNVVDGLAAAAVLAMGEGAEQTPMAIIRDVPRIAFTDQPPTQQERDAFQLCLDRDLYAPILKAAPWVFKTKQ